MADACPVNPTLRPESCSTIHDALTRIESVLANVLRRVTRIEAAHGIRAKTRKTTARKK